MICKNKSYLHSKVDSNVCSWKDHADGYVLLVELANELSSHAAFCSHISTGGWSPMWFVYVVAMGRDDSGGGFPAT